MHNAYIICMAIGLIIPCLSLILGGIGDFFDGLDLDFDFDFDIGDTSISFLPCSIQSICAGLLGFGATGLMLEGKYSLLWVNMIAGVIGYVVAIIIHAIIRKLKKVENTTYSQEELLLFDAKVVNTIVKGGFGAISIVTGDGVSVNFPAKAVDATLVIKQNEIVTIQYFEKNVAFVERKDLTVKYDTEETTKTSMK